MASATFNSLKRPLDSTNVGESLEPEPKKQCQEFEPRSYQVAVFEVARQRNTIAVLDTGARKTMIAVMLIRQIGHSAKVAGDNWIIVFLAPTVHLVNQKYEVIKIHTDLEVGQCYGAKGVDDWTAKCWEKQISTHQVLVMTTQILLDAFRNAFLTLDMVHLLIFDKCHHATGNHPYTRIMKEFYHKSVCKPHIFGMTASPVIRKGHLPPIKVVRIQISELSSMDAVRKHVWKLLASHPVQNIVIFQGKALVCITLSLRRCCMQLKKVSHMVIFLLIYAMLVVWLLVEFPIKFNRSLARHYESLLKTDYGRLETITLGYVTPKLHELIKVVLSIGVSNQVSSLIFVERIVTSKVIVRFMKKISYLSLFTVAYLTGGSSSMDALTPKLQKETLDLFRSGKVNLLFTTDVAEEGIHVPDCSCVIRFDLPKTVHSYVQ